MPLVMSFIRLHLQARWLQQRQQICLVQIQSYSSHLAHGQFLLAQHKFNIWLLLEAVEVADLTTLVVEERVVCLLLLVYQLLLVQLTQLLLVVVAIAALYQTWREPAGAIPKLVL
jgi:hypothetical protein